MNYRSFSRLKLIIGITILLGLLGAGLMSTMYMDHGAMIHNGCIGVGIGAPPCMNLVDIVSCLQVHLGVLQGISQAIPVNVSQLLVFLIAAVILWFGVKRKQSEVNILSQLHCHLKRVTLSFSVLLSKIEQWLTLHEKRDPAPATLVVFEFLFVPIM